MRKHRLPNLRVKIDAILDAELSVGRQLGLVGTPVYSCTVPTRCVTSQPSEDALLDISRRVCRLTVSPRALNEVFFLSDAFNDIA
jgi:hypothetical protein